MIRRTSHGFTIIEGLLILIIVGLIGFTGWYVWNSKNKTDNTYDSANNSSIPKYTAIKTFDDCKKSAGSKIQESFPEVCVTANGKRFTEPENEISSSWMLYQPPEKVYKINLADGWALYHYSQGDTKNDLETDSSKETVYKPGAKASVTVREQGGRGGLAYFNLRYNPSGGCRPAATAVKEPGEKTNSGLAITKYLYDSSKDSSYEAPYGKYKDYMYVITSGDKKVCIYYDETSIDSASKINIVESVVKTLEL